MYLLIKLNRKKIFCMLSIALFCTILLFLFLENNKLSPVLDDETNIFLESYLNKIFAQRNQAILTENIEILESLYNKNLRNGLWALEHELKKSRYLQEWSSKQTIQFEAINSQIKIRWAKQKKDGFSINLIVNTKYQYHYLDKPDLKNNFRIGTYHSLDLMPYNNQWLITREWYTDPFADSLNTDDLGNPEISKEINSKKSRNLTGLKQNRFNAIKYLDMYSGAASLPEYGFKYNPDYRNYNNLGGDCANFASQVLHEAGGFQKNRTWNYERGSGSTAWVNADAFNQYMIYSGRATRIAQGSYSEVLKASYNLLPGDYIAYQKKGKVVHISVVSGADSKGYILVNSHNTDRHRVPWDLGWSNKGISFHLVSVHY